MQCPSLSITWAVLLGSLATQSKAYPAWPSYVQAPRDYSDDDYPNYYQPQAQKIPNYYDAPVKNVPEAYGRYDAPMKNMPEGYGHYEAPLKNMPESYGHYEAGRVPYPNYYENYPSHYENYPSHYENYPSQYADEDPIRQDERLAALPVGQETYYESETEPPSWRSRDNDDINAVFLDNLILSNMARDAQRRREYNRNSQAHRANNKEERAMEDEDVRELKALADKPLYHTPKTAPKFEDDDYPADDAFINWNGNKRSIVTTSTAAPTIKPKEGQDEIMVPRPASTHHHHAHANDDKQDTVYNQITQLLENQARNGHDWKVAKSRKLEKRFVATDRDVVAELRGLKHRIPT